MGKTTERNRSTIYGIYYFSMTETGAVLALVMGFLIERFDFYYSYLYINAGSVLVMLICALLLRYRN